MTRPLLGQPIVEMNDLSRTPLARSAEVRDAVERVLRSGRFLLGSETEALAEELGDFLRVDHVVPVASGTDALVLAMLAVGLGPGTEVILAANAGGYGSIAAALVGAEVIYVDVDGKSGCVAPASVPDAITPRTRAVLVTHLYGNVAEVDALSRLCAPLGVAIIEDCAQAAGAFADERRAGSIGAIAAFSFYPTKNLGAAGDGGAVVTSDEHLAERVRHLRQYGWTRRYEIALKGGRNSRLDELQAAVLRIGLPQLDSRNAARVSILDRYRTAAPGLRWVTGAVPTVAHLAVLRTPDREHFRMHMRRMGVATDVHYPIADTMQAGLPRSNAENQLPETLDMVKEVVTVPCHPDLRQDEIERVAAALAEAPP